MKDIVILKTGSTFPELAAKKGDFEDWILAGMGIERNDALIVDVSQKHPLPEYDQIAGVVITGSHAMVTEQQDWSESLARWLPKVVELEIPLLGICYGHQLLAHALGGEAGNNPYGREFGTVDIHLAFEAKDDPLLGSLPTSFQVQVCHTQSALRLPPGAKVLASSVLEPHQAFVVGKCAWGVQFHPEFDAEAVKEYIRVYDQALAEQGIDSMHLCHECRETPHSSALLRRFYHITKNHFPKQGERFEF
jgi:GMP synthase (glutamine-hydrolysing)